jgi:hypothetical protein
MAKKVRCPGCGAKNPEGTHRCRVCTAIIDAAAPEAGPRGLAKSRVEEAAQSMAAEVNERPFDASELQSDFGRSGPPAPEPSAVPSSPVPSSPVSSSPVSSSPVSSSPMPSSPPPFEPVASAAPESFDAGGGGIDFDVMPRHVETPPPPPLEPESSESFDAGALGIDINVAARNASDAPPPIEYAEEKFDPNDLIIDPPR